MVVDDGEGVGDGGIARFRKGGAGSYPMCRVKMPYSQ